jgi:hypothetical protein
MVTASQTLKMYELLNKHFKSAEDAKAIVVSIEDIVDNKFNTEKDRLATKLDLALVKEDLKNDIGRLETRIEQGFKDQLKWLIILMVGLSSLAVAVMKLT